jgi:PilZ domain
MSQKFSPERRVPRYSFVAPAAVLPEKGVPVGGNVKELSLYGCFIDATSTLAPRTKVLVKIFMPGEYFEANATVAYANPTLGLGLVFRDVRPHFRTVLRKWLLMAMQLSQPSTLQGVTLDEGGEEDSGHASAEEKLSGDFGKKESSER